MLKKVDSFGFINLEGKAFYLHWSLAGEWVEITSRKGVNYAGTVVGKFKLTKPHAIYMKARPRLPKVKDRRYWPASESDKITDTCAQA